MWLKLKDALHHKTALSKPKKKALLSNNGQKGSTNANQKQDHSDFIK